MPNYSLSGSGFHLLLTNYVNFKKRKLFYKTQQSYIKIQAVTQPLSQIVAG